MSVQVKNLSKVYQTQRAVDDMSFTVEKGEVLGFLGPNGAGKTTTMKIITCFIPQTEGEVRVCDYDVTTQAMEVRARIGYLPEHNPLYKDMYVKEYLQFVGGLHKLPNIRQRIADIIEMTGLGREQHKFIGALSKGYRQRVGLAQAMLHDPEVLILDEPTSGLDPNQLVEIRSLIKQIGQEKTVIFSTHIMQEVQALCDRVVIINQGQKVADAPIDVLRSQLAGQHIVQVTFKEKIDQAALQAIPQVSNVLRNTAHQWQLTATGDDDLRETIFHTAIQNNWTILELFTKQQSVESVFRQLTQ